MLQLRALKDPGLDWFWAEVTRFRDVQTANGQLVLRRQQQTQAWMREHIEAGLRHRFRSHPAVQAALPAVTEEVRAGRLAASIGARRLLDLLD